MSGLNFQSIKGLVKYEFIFKLISSYYHSFCFLFYLSKFIVYEPVHEKTFYLGFSLFIKQA